jgi:hypothetical protein
MAKLTLTHGNATKELHQWPVNRVVRRRVSLGVDTVTFNAAHGNVDKAPFSYGDTIKLSRDGTQWFVGRVIAMDYGVEAKREVINYTLAGPWWYLEQLVFQRPWFAYYNQAGQQQVNTTHVLLHVADSSLVPIQDTFKVVVAYAASKGAPMQAAAAIDLPITPPVDEVRDMTCAEVIARMMRWHPDAVTWFDYTTNPPTLHAKRKKNLTKAPLLKYPEVKGVNFIPRYDRQKSSVAIRYELTTTVDGRERLQIIDDIAPVGAVVGDITGLTFTVSLHGPSVNTVSAEIETAEIRLNDPTWWLALFPTELAGPTIQGTPKFSETQGAYAPKRTLPNGPSRYLVNGAIADWMELDVAEESFEAWFDIESRGQNWPPEFASDRDTRVHRSIQLTTLDAESGTYSSRPEITPGDPLPIGIANQLYDSLKELQYEGSFTLVEQDCSGKVSVGMLASVKSNTGDSGPVDALVQEVTEEIDTGRTIVRFGPSNILGVTDLIALLE